MKLLPSPSISSSSSTTTSLDANNMCTWASPSCLSGILRRFLCSRGLPCDAMTETTSLPCHSNQQHSAPSSSDASPGIVDKLMGLESLPDKPTSLSFKSVEFGHQSKGRRHALPLHELPALLELENEQFFVLSFERRGDKKESRSREKKAEVGVGELKKKRRDGGKSKENIILDKNEDDDVIKKMVSRVVNEEQLAERRPEMPDQDFDCSSRTEKSKCTLPLDLMELWRDAKALPEEQKFTRTKKTRNGCRLKSEEREDCISEDSSPVSVLDFDRILFHDEVPTSDEQNTRRRKLSSTLNSYDHLTVTLTIWGQQGGSQGVDSIWTQKRACEFKDVEDIAADFGVGILNELIDELVDQLSLSSTRTN